MTSLFHKYNVPGPRYTSYPTVPYWDTNPTEAQWISSIAQALDENAPKGIGAALYLHIPFCESLCTFCGCNTRISRNHAVAAPYAETLLKEWMLYEQKIGCGQALLSELHLGGGTPTFMSPMELGHLLESLLSRFNQAKDGEYSLEADPRVTTKEHLKVLRNFGFKRLSLGIQDFDPRVQESVHRVQTEAQVKALVEDARGLGYTSVNFDLIYGLPFQTLKSVENTFDILNRLRPDRIAFYAYAHVPWIKPSQRRFTEDDLPSGEEKRALYELGRTILEGSGYREVGMDHFALTTDSLWIAAETKTLHRNFMGYTPRQVSPLIALGVSAIGDSWRVFAQNEKLLETYAARVEKGEIPITRGHVLNAEDLVLRRHVLNLMTKMETQWISPELDIEFLTSVPPKLTEFIADGLLELSDRACKITEKGRPFLRNICMAFDARLERKAPSVELFSKTI